MSQPYSYAERLRSALPIALDQWAAMRTVWSAFWLSRAAIWLAGVVAVLAVGAAGETSSRLDPFWLTIPFHETLANVLVAPGARWDSAWYLEIVQYGYDPDRAAFFPLYPAVVALAGPLFSPLLAGLLVSCACSLAGMYLLHRLVEVDFGADTARAVILIVAWFPSALVLSAVYSEGLFLLLSVGALYAARLGRWPLAALAAALAAGTRSSGVLLMVPLLIMYLYGPRADRPRHGIAAGWRPRHQVTPEVLWIAAVPAGLLAYLAYLWMVTGDPLSAFAAQGEWNRTLIPLVGGIALGAWEALAGVVELLPGIGTADVLADGQVPELVALRNVILFGFLLLAGWLVKEGARRLPAAYTAWAVAGLLLPVSVPALDEPLKSLPRFMLVLFPLWIALALWAQERGRLRNVVVAMGTLLVISTGLFATWVYPP